MATESRIFKPDTLLMFSGGIDSTGVFMHLLKEGKKIHVYHMNLMNKERRAKVEKMAVRNILQHVRNTGGDFIYSESSHEYPTYNNQFIFDSDIVSFMAGTICLATPWIKEVAIGMTASDADPDLEERIQRANKIFDAFGTKAVKIFPLKSLTKKQVYDSLSDELKKLTWSCRTPIYKDTLVIACGTCKSCEELKKLNA